MGHGFKSGAGGANPLNFSVVGGDAKPSIQKENTIWINTSTKISGWIIGSKQPENPKDGLAWIQTGDSGTNINALKKNEILLILSGAQQYVNGAWQKCAGEIYAEGKWTKFAATWNGELYDPGNQYTDITGGWSDSGWTSGMSGYTIKAPTIDDTGITLEFEQNKYTTVGTANKIDLSTAKTLYVTVSEAPENFGGSFAVNSEKKVGGAPMYTMTASVATTGPGEFALDVSSINEGYVVFFASMYVGAKLKITKIRLE